MSLKKNLSISMILGALAASSALVPAAFADENERHHGAMQMAQAAGPGTMTPGQGMRGERGPRTAGTDRDSRRAARHESRMTHMAERRIQLLDTDGDGKISVAEIVAEEKRLFAAADVNGDGKLSADEFRRRGRWFVRLGTMSFFDMLDADGDGQISATELTGPSERWFKRYDADKNGTIDTKEYVDSRARRGGSRR